MTSKGKLRHEFLLARRMVTSEVRHRADTAIRERLLALPAISGATCVLTYIGAPPEADTLGIIELLLAKNIVVLAPLMKESDVHMRWGAIRSLDYLVQAPFGMLQPPEDSVSTPPQGSPVIVPCVAFTSDCARLGRGGGHFDRFLAKHRGDRIGIAYERQRANAIPVEDHDVPLDVVVTESAIYPRS